MRMPSKIALIACLAVGVNHGAQADDSTAASRTQRLSELQGEAAVLKQELNVQQLRDKIAIERSTTAATLQGAPAPSGAGNGAPAPSTGSSAMPNVVAIGGVGGPLAATLQYDSGAEITVRAGSMLPHGYRVTRVDTDGVTVADSDGAVHRLAFGTVHPTTAGPMQGPVQLPPLPR